jgi:hypothetical protein
VKSTNYEEPHYAVISTLLLFPFLLCSHILLSTLFSDIMSLWSFLTNLGDQFSRPYETKVSHTPRIYVYPSSTREIKLHVRIKQASLIHHKSMFFIHQRGRSSFTSIRNKSFSDITNLCSFLTNLGDQVSRPFERRVSQTSRIYVLFSPTWGIKFHVRLKEEFLRHHESMFCPHESEKPSFMSIWNKELAYSFAYFKLVS